MEEKPSFYEKVLEGLSIIYHEPRITVFPAASALSNFGNIEKNIYPIRAKYTEGNNRHRAVLDLKILIRDVDLEAILLEFNAAYIISRNGDNIDEQKDLSNLTDFSLGLIREYVEKHAVRDLQGQLLSIPPLTSSPIHFKGWIKDC